MKGINLSIQKNLIYILVCWIAVLSCFGLFTRADMKELSIITEKIDYEPLTVGIIALFSLLFMLIIKSIVMQISKLKASVDKSSITGKLTEEQQQRLKQQSEELKMTNAQMEEQKQLLENQSALLSSKNKQLEKSKQELLSYSQKLEVASKYKSEFMANMSHELRTPLNSIILLSRLLMKEVDQDENQPQMEKLSIINSSGKELLRLIDEILDLSKIEAGRMDLYEAGFYSRELLKELRQLFQSFAEEKNIEFKVENNVSSLIYGDYNKISQILRNFISNAIKFTEGGGVTLEALLNEEERVVFAVTDTGIGISENNIKIIFEEFHQEDGSISRRFGGTGLGLSISKKLADLMGADIKVKSMVGAGSCFELHLRANDKPQCHQEVAADECAAATFVDIKEAVLETRSLQQKSIYLTSRTNKEYSLRLDDKRILIVDDDPKNVFVLATVLEACGAEIIEAQEGEAALSLLKQEPIDLVLIDIMMPIMDGYQTIKLIREEGLKDIPIIVISAKSRRSDREESMAAGANGYIAKPVDYDNLMHLIKTWIEKE